MILIIGAMPEEVMELSSLMENVEQHQIEDIQVWEGLLSDKPVVLALSGVGKVNAAFTSSVLIAHYKPEYVLNIGSAGGLQDGQKVGDVVISTTLQYHDLDIGPNTHTDPRFIFDTDIQLREHAKNAVGKLGLPYHLGLIVTGDQFITKVQPQFKHIQNTFPDAICVEMESAAIGAVCKRFEIPFVVLRSLSDITHEDDNNLTFEEYLHVASKNSAKICKEFVSHI